MKKTITVCGYDIPVAVNAASLIKYKMVFHSDAMADLMALAKAADGSGDVDIETMYRFLWIFAKSADDEIADFVTWFEQFDVEPLSFVTEALPPIMDLLGGQVKTTVKSKKK